MNVVNYDRQVLTDYLLGSLPEAETERFDELSITDDDFAVLLNDAENDLVDAYSRGELSGAQLEKFNSYYLASPLRREKVNFSRAFQDFAKKKVAVIDEKSAGEESRNGFSAFFSAFNIFAAPNAFLRLSFAAALLVLIIFGGWVLLKNSLVGNSPAEFQAGQKNLPTGEPETRPDVNLSPKAEPEKEIAKSEENLPENLPVKEPVRKSPVEQTPRKDEKRSVPPKVNTAPPRKISIASFILTPPLRGNNQLQTVSVAPETDFAAVQLELESDDYAAYRVALIDRASGKNLWQSGRLKSKSSGESNRLSVRFPAKLLKPQIYSLSVSGITMDGTIENISDYSFRVVR